MLVLEEEVIGEDLIVSDYVWRLLFTSIHSIIMVCFLINDKLPMYIIVMLLIGTFRLLGFQGHIISLLIRMCSLRWRLNIVK